MPDYFTDIDRSAGEKTRDKVLRAPFGYPGGKSRSVERILNHLPYRDTYVEAFGGSGAVLLARDECKLEVFNDRYAGVVAFYRCLRDPVKLSELTRRLHLCLHSREEFVWCRDTWENVEDDIERAARWFYMVRYSFGQLGRNFGRATSSRSNIAGKLVRGLKLFPELNARLFKVQIENQDWRECLYDYDDYQTVFYLDPPYIDVNPGTYKVDMRKEDHDELLATIFELKGFVALSAYNNKYYLNRGWDDVQSWKVFSSIDVLGAASGNNRDDGSRNHVEECLFIKEAKR